MTALLWKSVERVDTAATVPWNQKHLNRCDPYLVWADASTRAPKDDSFPNIAVLLELNQPNDLQALLARMDPPNVPLRMVPNQLSSTYPTVFITALFSRDGLRQLIGEVLAGTIKQFVLQGARADLTSTTFRLYDLFLHHSKTAKAAAQGGAPRGGGGVGVGGPTYLGILDDGLPFLRARDSIAAVSNPAHLWDQGWSPEGLASNPDNPTGQPPGPSDDYWRLASDAQSINIPLPNGMVVPMWVPSKGFLYGRRTKKLPPTSSSGDDRDEYSSSHYVHPAPRQTHGASVLGLMAPWLSTRRKKVIDWPLHISGLAMVQLPTLTVDDTSGGSLAMRVLDGLRYVLWQELEDRPSRAPARPTVVNVSYGVNAGPHDGSSMFERAAQEALAGNQHLHLVLPMGNAHRTGIHARRKLGPLGARGDHTELEICVAPDNPRDTFVEIWLPNGAEVAVEISPPGESKTYRLSCGEAKMAYVPEPGVPAAPYIVRFAGIYPQRVANGQNGTMVLIAIGSTRPRFPHRKGSPISGVFAPVGANQQRRHAVIAPHGRWHVTLRNCTATGFIVNAWIERDDPAPDRLAGNRQAYFPDSMRPEVRTYQSAPEGTTNGVATFQDPHLHVIGAMRADGRLSAYSAARVAAATGRPPTTVTVADFSPALRGILSLGFTKGAVSRLDGTSAACAVYSRALAVALAKNPSQLPHGPSPGFVAPEIDGGSEDEPSASDSLRGEGVRTLLPFDVEIVTRR